MKKLNLFLCVFLCTSACLFVSCDDKDDFQGETLTYKTMELGLDLSKVDLVQTRSGAITGDDYLDASYEVPYCDADLATGDIVVMNCNVVFKDESGTTVGSSHSQMWQWSVLDATSATGRLSDLVQIDYPIDATMALFTVTDFRVYDSSGTTLKFLTPRESSAYAGYVTTAVDEPFEIDLYEKQYVKLEVLCFDEADIPLFGFAWADFEVISGDEVCIFFNCLEESSAMSYHQVISVDIEASYLPTGSDEWIPYWEGSNYEFGDDHTDIDIKPVCVLCPGNWSESGIRLVVTPTYSMYSFEIYLTADQIGAFLTATETDWEMDEDRGTASIDLSAGTPYIHYILNDCYKPDAYLSDIKRDGSERYSDIYALSWTDKPFDSTFMMTKIFTAPDDCHIAMTPDATKLILSTEGMVSDDEYNGWGTSISVYDIYSFKKVQLTFIEPDLDKVSSPITSDYFNFTQLVYVNDVLYAGCSDNDILVSIIIDFNMGTFTYGSDFTSMENLSDIKGGDLLAGENGRLYSLSQDDAGAVIRYLAENGIIKEGYESDHQFPLLNLTGCCALEGSMSAITSHKSLLTSQVYLMYWESKESPIYYNTGIYFSVGGDMASPFNFETEDDIQNILDFRFF